MMVNQLDGYDSQNCKSFYIKLLLFLFPESISAIIESKTVPGYSLSLTGGDFMLVPGDHWLTAIKPGNKGQPNTVSFKMANGLWLGQRHDIVALTTKDTNWFNFATTFSLRTDGRPDPFVAFESIVRRSNYIKVSGNQIQLDRFKHYSLFLDQTSWKISEKSKFPK